MKEKPLPSVFFHFRFKFIAVTSIAFLIYIILSGSREFSEFAKSPEFRMLGPFLIFAMVLYFIFRKFPIKCPSCAKILPTKKNWKCPDCGKFQGRDRYLMDKCLHCKQILSTSFCDHCGEEFRL
ncbi:MAG: hypothetical protein A3J80_00410 [Desulfobacula sp. RIFOXYB2_FULL_45_6]|nr:MAG: hypothetical protein A3J80_00410 [Desulfobacula sp. RIFOXYB2_FULL_45_6]